MDKHKTKMKFTFFFLIYIYIFRIYFLFLIIEMSIFIVRSKIIFNDVHFLSLFKNETVWSWLHYLISVYYFQTITFFYSTLLYI